MEKQMNDLKKNLSKMLSFDVTRLHALHTHTSVRPTQCTRTNNIETTLRHKFTSLASCEPGTLAPRNKLKITRFS